MGVEELQLDLLAVGQLQAVQVDALRLARADAAGDLDAALVSFDRAIDGNRDFADPQRAAAQALIDAGRLDEASERLQSLLDEFPYDGEAAGLMIGIDLSRDRVTDRTAELGKRVVRFGGGPEALDQVAVAFDILVFQVIEQATTLVYHAQQSAA